MIKLRYKYYILAIKGIFRSTDNDVILSWNFVVGAIAGFLCRFFRYQRKVIALNMIAHEKGFLNRILRKYIYNSASKNRSFWFSVNDDQLRAYYLSLFNFSLERVFILHDVYHKIHKLMDYEWPDNYVFTGGETYRDWSRFIKYAEDLPDIRFVGVARNMHFSNKEKLPTNLKMYFDILEDEFYSLLKKCRIVFLPLTSLAPCGLIVIIKAALFSKPVIVTETPSIKNYISNGISGTLIKMNDLEEMKNSIQKLYYSEGLRKLYAENLKKHIIENFSSEKNVKIIEGIIRA